MPRKARIDAPGALHHIICRGIERRKIFPDDTDRDEFIRRLGTDVLGDGFDFITFYSFPTVIPMHHDGLGTC